MELTAVPSLAELDFGKIIAKVVAFGVVWSIFGGYVILKRMSKQEEVSSTDHAQKPIERESLPQVLPEPKQTGSAPTLKPIDQPSQIMIIIVMIIIVVFVLVAFGVILFQAVGHDGSSTKPVVPPMTSGISQPVTNSIGMKFVRIEPGEFNMGCPANELSHSIIETQHKLKIAKAFYMGVHEVTQGQYKAITGQNPSYFKGRDDHPVEQVSWEDAIAFCKKLSDKEGKKYRLPTEAEWEYACRAGTTTPFSFGNTISTAEANYDGTYRYGSGVQGVFRGATIPVGSLKKPNAWGLHDMHGNVNEWCNSKYANYPYRADDGREEGGGKALRVYRGGYFGDDPAMCRSAARGLDSPDYREFNFGFRVVLDF